MKPKQSQGGARAGVIHTLPVGFTEEQLARAAAARHPAAARAVWDQYAGLIYGLLQRVMGPQGEVEDLVQETFLRFFDCAGKLQQPDKLRSFIVGIAMRVARQELRRRRVRRWLWLTDDGAAVERAAPPADHVSREALRRLYELLDRVDGNARVLFALRYIEQLELIEISEILGCSLATTKRRLARAAQRIRKLAVQEPALRAFVSSTESSTEEASVAKGKANGGSDG